MLGGARLAGTSAARSAQGAWKAACAPWRHHRRLLQQQVAQLIRSAPGPEKSGWWCSAQFDRAALAGKDLARQRFPHQIVLHRTVDGTWIMPTGTSRTPGTSTSPSISVRRGRSAPAATARRSLRSPLLPPPAHQASCPPSPGSCAG